MSRRRVAVLCVGLAILALAGWAALGRGHSTPSVVSARFDIASDRMQKTDLIQRLASPPEVVILGGSRALRFDPAYLQERTGLGGFNAAVTGARPEDAWALVSLFHARFPRARFRFLWIIHADEFDPKPLDPGLVYDATLAGFFPPALITPRLRSEADHLRIDPMQQGRVFAANGCVISDGFGRMFPRSGADAAGVRNNIAQALHTYATTPARLSTRSVLYFQKTLALMQSIGATPPIIVSAPVDRRIMEAIANRGWRARQDLLLRLLGAQRKHYRFSFADLSKAASCGCTATDFFDGIHLRPSGARKVTDIVLRRFPSAFASTGHPETATPSPTGL